jgi:hypothetical protein
MHIHYKSENWRHTSPGVWLPAVPEFFGMVLVPQELMDNDLSVLGMIHTVSTGVWSCAMPEGEHELAVFHRLEQRELIERVEAVPEEGSPDHGFRLTLAGLRALRDASTQALDIACDDAAWDAAFAAWREVVHA